MMYHKEKSPSCDGAAVKMSDRPDKTPLSVGNGAPGAPNSDHMQEGYPPDDLINKIAALPHQIMEKFSQELSDVDTNDLVDGELTEVSPGLGLLAGLADAAKYQTCVSINTIEESTAKDVATGALLHGSQQADVDDAHSQTEDEGDDDDDDDDDIEDEDDEDDDDDDEGNSTSDGSPTGDGDWTELEDNASEDMDPSKLAALSSAFSTHFSMAKMSRLRTSPHDGSAGAQAPPLGQFLLPLVTDQTSSDSQHTPAARSTLNRMVIRNEDILKVLSSASEFVTESDNHDAGSGGACKRDVLRLFEKYGAIMAQHMDKFVPEHDHGVDDACGCENLPSEEPPKRVEKTKKLDLSHSDHHQHFSICNVFRNNIEGISAKELEILQAKEVGKLCKLLNTLDPTGESLKPDNHFNSNVADDSFEVSKTRVQIQSERFEDVRRQIEQMYPGSFDDCPVDKIDLSCHNDKLLDKLISKIDEKIIPKEGRFGFDVSNNKRNEQTTQPLLTDCKESENFQNLLLDSTSKVSDLLHYLQNWSVEDIDDHSSKEVEHTMLTNCADDKGSSVCEGASFNRHLKDLLQNFPGFDDESVFCDDGVIGCEMESGNGPSVKRSCCSDQYLRGGGVCKTNGCHLEVAPLMRSVERYLMKHLNESFTKKPPPVSPATSPSQPARCINCHDCLDDTLDIRIMSDADDNEDTTDTSDDTTNQSEEPEVSQMLFDCDSINVKDRFVSDPTGLCPGGCANKTPCAAFRKPQTPSTMSAKANSDQQCMKFLKDCSSLSAVKKVIQGLNAAVKSKVPLDLEIVQKTPLFGEEPTVEAANSQDEEAPDAPDKTDEPKTTEDREHPFLSELRFIDLQAAWWDLRVLILTVYRVAEMRPAHRRDTTIVAYNPTCHCCHCAYGRVNCAAVMNMIGGLMADSAVDSRSSVSEASSTSRCTCIRGISGRKRGRGGKGIGRVKTRVKMSEGRCHSCTAKGRMFSKRVRPEMGTMKLFQKLQSQATTILCCCNQSLTALHDDMDFAQVTVFFEDESTPVKVDLLSGEIIPEDQNSGKTGSSEKGPAYFEECFKRHKKGVHVEAASQRAFKPACQHCRCQCKRPRFLTEKDITLAIRHIIDNFNRLAMRVLMHRLNALSLALVARHGAQLASTLANKSAPQFLLELSWRTQALMEGSHALGLMLGPKRHLLAHCFSLLMPDALLSAVYRRWADGPAANIVVQLCILMGRGEAPEKSVEALKAFASCLPIIRKAEALHKSINFVPRYDEYQPAVVDDQLERARDKYLREERTHLIKARRLYRNAIPPIGDDSPRHSVSSNDEFDDDVSQIALKSDSTKSCGEIQTTLTDDNLKIATAAIVAILDCNNASSRRRLSRLLDKLVNISKSKSVSGSLPPENVGPDCFASKNLLNNLESSDEMRKISRGPRKKRPISLKDKRRYCKTLGVGKRGVNDAKFKSKVPSIDECETFQEVAKFCGITLNRGGKVANADQLAAKMIEYKNFDEKSAAQYERMVSRLNELNDYDSVFDNNYTIQYLNQLASRSSINWDSDTSDINNMFINNGKSTNLKTDEDEEDDLVDGERINDDGFVIVENEARKVDKLDSVEDLSTIADMIIKEEDKNNKKNLFAGYIENNSKMEGAEVKDSDEGNRYDGEDPEDVASRICNRLWFDAEKRADVQADAVRWLVATVKAGSVETMRVLTEFDNTKSIESSQSPVCQGGLHLRGEQEYFNDAKPVLNTSPSTKPAVIPSCLVANQPSSATVVPAAIDAATSTALRSRPSKRKLKSNPSTDSPETLNCLQFTGRKKQIDPSTDPFKKWTMSPANYSFNSSESLNIIDTTPNSEVVSTADFENIKCGVPGVHKLLSDAKNDIIGNEDLSLIMANLAVSEESGKVDHIVPENLTNILCDIVMTTKYASGELKDEDRESSPTNNKADRNSKTNDSSKSPLSKNQPKSKISTEMMQRIADLFVYQNALAEEDTETEKTIVPNKSAEIAETLAPPSSPQADNRHSPPLHELSPSGSISEQGNTHYQNRKLTALNQILKVFGVDMSSKIVNEDMTSEITRKSQMVSALMEEDNNICGKRADDCDNVLDSKSSPPSTPKKRRTICSDATESDEDNVKHIVEVSDVMVKSHLRKALHKGVADKFPQLPARFLDESMLTPETVEQIREVRILNNKKLAAGSKRKANIGDSKIGIRDKKTDEDFGVSAWSSYWDGDSVTGEHPCDPTPEDLMREMINYRDNEKGYTKRQFEKQLFISASQTIVAKVLAILMPIAGEGTYLSESSNKDVKVGKVLDGFRIEDYWDEIKPHFGMWRRVAVSEYWDLPAHYQMRKKQAADCADTKDDKKPVVKKITQCDDIIPVDVPMDQAYFVERYQAVNRQYCEKVMNNDYSGEDWVKTMTELHRLESKLKFAVDRAQQKQLKFDVREAESVAGRGLGKLINQSYTKKKDESSKSVKTDEKTVEKTTPKDKSDVEVKMDFKALKEYMREYIANSDATDDIKTIASDNNCNKDVKKSISVDKDAKKTIQSDKDVKKSLQDDKSVVIVEDGKAIVVKDAGQEKQKSERGVRVVDGVALKDGVPIKDSITIRDILSGFDEEKLQQAGAQKLLQDLPQNKMQQQRKAVASSQLQQTLPVGGTKANDHSTVPAKAHSVQGKPLVNAGKGKSLLKGCEGAGDGQHHHCLGDGGASSHAESCGSEDQNRCSRHPDASRSNSHSTSSSGNSVNNNSDHPCNCCYCTVFGHAPPVTTPVSRNFNETRERLRLILNRKKQRSGRSNASQTQPTAASQTTGDAENQELPGKASQNPTNQTQTSQAPQSVAANNNNNVAAACANNCATQNKVQQRQPPPGFSPISSHSKMKPSDSKPATKSKTITPTMSETSNNSSRTSSTSSGSNINKNGSSSTANQPQQPPATTPTLYEKGLALLAGTKAVQSEKPKVGMKAVKSNSTSSSNQTSSANSASPSPSPAGQSQTPQLQKTSGTVPQPVTKKVMPAGNNTSVGRSRQTETSIKGKGHAVKMPVPVQNQTPQGSTVATSTTVANTNASENNTNNNNAFNAGLSAGLTDGIAAVLSIYSNSRTASTSRDTSAYSTSSICSGCSADTVLLEDTRDLNMLVEFIEGPGRAVDKVKKQAKKARQRAKKMIEKLVADRENLRQDILQKLGEAKYLRKEAIKFDKEIASRRKPQGGKGKKKQGNPGQLSTASESALEACAKATRAVATRAEDSVTSMREKLRRTETAIERLAPTVAHGKLPVNKKKALKLLPPDSASVASNKEPQPTTTLIPNYNGPADIRLLANEHAILQQNGSGQQQPRQGDSIGAQTGQQSNNGMVTIKRVMLPDRDEPGVTITAGGYEQSPYQYMGMFQYSSDKIADQQQTPTQTQQQSKPQQQSKKASAPSWESTLAQINALSQSKSKKSGDKKKPQKTQSANTNPAPVKKPTSAPMTRDSSSSLCSDLGQTDQLTKKQRRKQAALFLQRQKEEEEELALRAVAIINETAAKKTAAKNNASLKQANNKNIAKEDEKKVNNNKNVTSVKAKPANTVLNDKSGVSKSVKGITKNKSEDTSSDLAVKKKSGDSAEVVLGSFSSLSLKDQKKGIVSKGNNVPIAQTKPAGKTDAVLQKGTIPGKAVRGAQKSGNVQQPQQPNNVVSGKKGSNAQQHQVTVAGNKNQQYSAHQSHSQQSQWKQPAGSKPLAVQGERIRLNADTTIEIAANKSLQSNIVQQPVRNQTTQPAIIQQPMHNQGGHHQTPETEGPASCSIMEQLRSGVQVADLKLPPGITLTWVDPAKSVPNPNTAKSAIPSVKLTSAVPVANRPTPPVVAPPAVIMVDTTRLQADREKNNQQPVVNTLPPHPNANMDPSQQRPVGSRQKKSKRRYKRPTQPSNLNTTSSSTHSTTNAASNTNATVNSNNPPTKMVTLRNPMFHPGPMMNHNESINSTRRIPDPIPMPPSSNPGQATITPTSNGMYTIRNPLMSMVHARSIIEQQSITEQPPVSAQPNNGYVNNDIKRVETGSVPPKSVVDSVNLNFMPNKDRGYSLFKQESEEADNNTAVAHTNSVNYNNKFATENLQNPIGSSRSYNSMDNSSNSKNPGARMNDVNHGIPEPIGTPLGARKVDNSADTTVIGNLTEAFKNVTCSSGHQGLYRQFGASGASNDISEKVFGSGLFQPTNIGRDEQCYSDKQMGWPCQESETVRKEKEDMARQASYLYRSDSSTNCHHPQQLQQSALPNNNVVEISLVHEHAAQLNQSQHYRPMSYGPHKTWGPYSEYPSTPNANFYSQYGGRFTPRTPQPQLPINSDRVGCHNIVSSHSSSSSGLLSGNSSVYDSVSNSSSNSPADSSVNALNVVTVPGENIATENVIRMSPNRLHHMHHQQQQQQQHLGLMNSQSVQPILYNNINQYSNVEDNSFDQPLNLTTGRNSLHEPPFNQDLIPHNIISDNSNMAFNQLPNMSYNMGGFANARLPINHEGFQSRMGSDGSYGFGFEQQNNSSGFNSYGSQYNDSGSGCSSLGAIGSQRVAFNGTSRNSADYFGDSGSVFAPDQSITNLNELESTDRDIETFKRFDFYFEPPKNKPKISLNLNDIALQPKTARDK